MTVVNYLELNELVDKYGNALVILGFPCAQFYNQEPGKNDEILNCIKFVRPGNGYVPKFTLFEKSLVNGDPAQINPVYIYLRASCPQPSPIVGVMPFISWSPVTPVDITWNWEKFLIDKTGKPYKRYVPQTNPLTLLDDINHLIAS